MRPGGTVNTKVFQADLNEIQSGQFYNPSLIRLPLLPLFRQGATDAANATSATPYGGRPDLATATLSNPIVGNTAGGSGILPVRIQIQEPANCLQLIWHALDPGGNYQCSYPLNSAGNADPTSHSWPATIADTRQRWAFGWLRLNGLGPWFPMSLLPSTQWVDGGSYLAVFPFGGFSSINAPMSFFDWVGYWDGGGVTAESPLGGVGASNAFILAITSVNTSLSSNGGTLGNIANYATPSGSGTEATPPNTDTQRNQDILVRSGNGRS